MIAMRRALATLIAFAMTSTLLGCTAGSEARGLAVTKLGGVYTDAGVTVSVPPDAVQELQRLTITAEPRDRPSSFDGVDLIALGAAATITLGEGVQPTKSLEVTLPLDGSTAEPGTVAFLVQSSDGSLGLLPAQLSADGRSATATVPHLSIFQPVTIDLSWVRDAVLQSLGLETARPDCVDQPYSTGQATYSVISPATVWLCAGDGSPGIAVTAQSNTSYPYVVTPSDRAIVPTTLPDVSFAAALDVALGSALGLIAQDQAGLFPGGRARFTTELEYPFSLEFEVAPVLMWVSILTRTLDIVIGGLNVSHLERIGQLECLADVLDTGTSVTDELAPATVAGVYGSFFSCVSPALGDLPGPQRVLLGMISAAPQLLIGSILGALSPINGTDHFTSTVEVELDGDALPALWVPEFLGTWSGAIDQPGSVAYTTELHLRGGASGDLVGSVRYPELGNCSGYLDSFRLDGDALFTTEHIQDSIQCVEVVPLELTLRPDGTMEYRTLVYGATGVLTRDPASGP